ncbi:hypothetical protein NKI18_27205, partial [Mesorhizobium sp. M0800]
ESVIATSPPCHGRSPLRAGAVLSPKLFAEPSAHYRYGEYPTPSHRLSQHIRKAAGHMADIAIVETRERVLAGILFTGAAYLLFSMQDASS